jgi:uncharacterized protein YuzE
MNEYGKWPTVNKGAKTITIAFAPLDELASQMTIDIPLILDLDLNNDVIGIEALSFCSYGGSSALVDFDYSALEPVNMRLSYDEEVDALALRIDDGRSITQRSVKGKLLLDSIGRMIGIEASLE